MAENNSMVAVYNTHTDAGGTHQKGAPDVGSRAKGIVTTFP